MALLPRLYLILALFVIACCASAQTNVSGHSADGQTRITWDDSVGLSGVNKYDVYRSSAPITNVAGATGGLAATAGLAPVVQP